MQTRNVTLSLPVELVRQAKIYAAQHNTSIHALVRELLQEKIFAEARVRGATERFLQLAEQGPYASIDPSSIRREELYERG